MTSNIVPIDIFNIYGDPLKMTGDEAIYLCPHCIEMKGSPDKSGHLYINIKNKKYMCHRCGIKGRLVKSNYSQTINTNSDGIVNLVKGIFAEDEEDGIVLNEYNIPIESVLESKTARTYMHKRGFSDEELSYYNIRTGGLYNKMFGRVVIPNKISDLVYTDMYSARAFIDLPKKYLNPNGKNASVIVFNLHNIKDNPDRIILTEGALTSISAGVDAVAAFGKAVSTVQLEKILAKNPKELIVNLDGDAKKESIELCNKIKRLKPELPIKNIVLPIGVDANDFKSYGRIDEYREIIDKTEYYNPLILNIKELLDIN